MSDENSYKVMVTVKGLRDIADEKFINSITKQCELSIGKLMDDFIFGLEEFKNECDGTRHWYRILTKIELIPEEDGNPWTDFTE